MRLFKLVAYVTTAYIGFGFIEGLDGVDNNNTQDGSKYIPDVCQYIVEDVTFSDCSHSFNLMLENCSGIQEFAFCADYFINDYIYSNGCESWKKEVTELGLTAVRAKFDNQTSCFEQHSGPCPSNNISAGSGQQSTNHEDSNECLFDNQCSEVERCCFSGNSFTCLFAQVLSATTSVITNNELGLDATNELTDFTSEPVVTEAVQISSTDINEPQYPTTQNTALFNGKEHHQTTAKLSTTLNGNSQQLIAATTSTTTSFTQNSFATITNENGTALPIPFISSNPTDNKDLYSTTTASDNKESAVQTAINPTDLINRKTAITAAVEPENLNNTKVSLKATTKPIAFEMTLASETRMSEGVTHSNEVEGLKATTIASRSATNDGPAKDVSIYSTAQLETGSTETSEHSYVNETILRNHLRQSYVSKARPERPTVLRTFYTLKALKSLDISEEKMVSVGWLTLIWEDQRLAWNPSDYMGIRTLEVSWGWRPNFFVANEIQRTLSLGYSADPMRVYHYGLIRWLVPLNMETRCDVGVENFPFDTQSCPIDFIYWMTSKQETLLIKTENDTKVNLDFLQEHGEWKLYDTKDEVLEFDVCCPNEIMQKNTITLQFRRRRPYYAMNVIVPTVLISLCVPWVFVLPSESGEKMGFSLTILVAYTVLLTLSNEYLPSTSQRTPTLATYLLGVLVSCLVSVSLTVWSLKLYSRDDYPPYFIQIIFEKIRYVVYCQHGNLHQDKNSRINTEEDETITKAFDGQKKIAVDQSIIKDKNVEKHTKDQKLRWRDVAEVVDRLSFMVLSICVGILNVVLIANLTSVQIQTI